METWLLSLLDSMGAWPFWGFGALAFLGAALEMVFPPVPGQTIAIIIGFLAVGDRLARAPAHLALFAFGTVIGAWTVYAVGRHLGLRLFRWRIFAWAFPPDQLGRVQAFFDKRGVWAILFAKFIPGIGSLAVLCAGMLKMSRAKSGICIALVSAFHAMVFFCVGLLLGRNRDQIAEFTTRYSVVLWSAVAVGVIGYTAWKILKRRRKKA